MAQQSPQQHGSQESTIEQQNLGTHSTPHEMSGTPQQTEFQSPIQHASPPQQGQGASGQSQRISEQAAQGGPPPHGGRNLTLEEGISDEMRVTLHDFVQSANACEWCATQCLDEGPQMAECVRLCRDVADLARMNAQLLTRDSAFGPEVAEVFVSAAEACADECAQHSHKHCQECAEVLTRAARSTRKMISSFRGAQPGQL